MDNSEDQFQELIAQLVGRASRMLAERSEVFPMGLLLMPDGSLDVSVAAYESVKQIPDLLSAMQGGLSEKAQSGPAVASCIAYPDYEAGEIVALLENAENYCATVRIPVAGTPTPEADLENIAVEDGSVYVFPVNG